MTEHRPASRNRRADESVQVIRLCAYGFMIAALTLVALLLLVGLRRWELPAAIAAGCAGAGGSWIVSETIARGWAAAAFTGSSTPYIEQFSMQDSLVMRGDVDQALRSLESLIADQPNAIAARIKSAELYVKQRDNQRAAELFTEALRVPSISAGEDVYVRNRLVDLLSGPLDQPGRALVELRRLIDRHPESAAAKHAGAALSTLKERLNAAPADV
jgi:tetratricopeptide (TPR) repeat protein